MKTKNNFILYEPYQLPFDYDGILQFHINHRVGNLEWFDEDNRMHRVIADKGKIGQIIISNDAKNSRLIINVDFPDQSILKDISARVRNLFDLDANPKQIQKTLSTDIALKKLLKNHPGLRVPGAWDAFEIAVLTILGQVVSVARGRALAGEFIELVGKDTNTVLNGKPIKLFPTPEEIIAADLTPLKTTSTRKVAIKALSQAILNKEISLDSDQDVESFIEKFVTLKGIGSWTANYVALKFLRQKDAFPANDLIIARALKLHSSKIIETMRPWRGYVTILMWKSYAGILKKEK